MRCGGQVEVPGGESGERFKNHTHTHTPFGVIDVTLPSWLDNHLKSVKFAHNCKACGVHLATQSDFGAARIPITLLLLALHVHVRVDR